MKALVAGIRLDRLRGLSTGLIPGFLPRRGTASEEIDLDADPDAAAQSAAGRRRAAFVALGVPLLLGGATVLWLSLTAGDTMRLRQAAVPRVVVPVVDAAGPVDGRTNGEPGVPELLNPLDAPVEMAAAPDTALVEPTAEGPLPRIGADGRTPWQTYARPFVHEETRPRIALVLAEGGFSEQRLRDAVGRLPGAVTLALSPHAPRLADWIEAARLDGHEILLDLPMEPTGYPKDDPGPNSLLTLLSADENLRRLHRSLGRAAGYVGVTSLSGSAFATRPQALDPVLDDVNERGLLLLDARPEPRGHAAARADAIGLPRAIADTVVDRSPSPRAIDAELSALEETALRGGTAVGIMGAYPVTLDRLAAWMPSLEAKGITLAPISAVVNRQPASAQSAPAQSAPARMP